MKKVWPVGGLEPRAFRVACGNVDHCANWVRVRRRSKKKSRNPRYVLGGRGCGG